MLSLKEINIILFVIFAIFAIIITGTVINYSKKILKAGTVSIKKMFLKRGITIVVLVAILTIVLMSIVVDS